MRVLKAWSLVGLANSLLIIGSASAQETTLLEAHFDGDAEGFGFADDTFRGTSEPAYASGSHTASGFSGGGLRVDLGGINGADIFGMSGGWEQNFTVTETAEVTLSFRYKLSQTATYEVDEYSEMLVSLNGALIGIAPNDFIAEITGDGKRRIRPDHGLEPGRARPRVPDPRRLHALPGRIQQQEDIHRREHRGRR